MVDQGAMAANKLVDWLQAALRKSTAEEDDLEEDQYVHPCQFMMDNFPDNKSQTELATAFQDLLKMWGNSPAPITTVGNSDHCRVSDASCVMH